MSHVLRLTLPYPPSANEYWVPAPGRGLVPSKTSLVYKATVRRLCAGVRPLFGDVVLSGVVYRPRAVGDLGNRLKVLEDALQGVAYLDDDQVCEYRSLRRDLDRENPRVELQFEGERECTLAEVADALRARSERTAKTRATRNRNRLAKRMVRRGRLVPAVERPR